MEIPCRMVTRLHRLQGVREAATRPAPYRPREHASARTECTRIAHKLRRRPQVLFDIASASNTLPAWTSMPLHTLCEAEGSCLTAPFHVSRTSHSCTATQVSRHRPV